MKGLSIRSKRLSLRLVTINDLKPIHDLHSAPETDRFNTLGIPENEKETKAILENWLMTQKFHKAGAYTLVIETIANQQFLGLIAIKVTSTKAKTAQIWYKLHPIQWGYGYATEAVKAIIKFGFEELKLHRIEASCATANVASLRVLEKSGMNKEGHKRLALPLKTGWSDTYEYAIVEKASQ